jgi:hypothetical protein
VAQEAFVGSSSTISLSAMPRISRDREKAVIKSLLDLELKSREEKEEDARQKIAVALARLGMMEKALTLSTNAKSREEMHQMAAFRSIFLGTTANAFLWIKQIPPSVRAYSQLQLARRLVFGGHKREALEVLSQIPLPYSIKAGDLSMLSIQNDVALTEMLAGNKAASNRRFAILTAAVRKLSNQDAEFKEQAESG